VGDVAAGLTARFTQTRTESLDALCLATLLAYRRRQKTDVRLPGLFCLSSLP
jgi:hypothetical protein